VVGKENAETVDYDLRRHPDGSHRREGSRLTASAAFKREHDVEGPAFGGSSFDGTTRDVRDTRSPSAT
jgi:hypothetical protein